MLFIEILLSIHCLLLLSSWLVGGCWLAKQPSFKLKLARLLLVSCVISPLLVHCIEPTQKPERLKYVSLDALQEYVSQPILKTEQSGLTCESEAALTISNISYCQVFCIIFCLLILFRSYRVLLDLGKLRSMLGEAIPYRTSGKLVIKVSHHCHIPFSVYFFRAMQLTPLPTICSSQCFCRNGVNFDGLLY